MSIYVEILMQTEIEKLWEYTQTPQLHGQWDLRFSEITYLPKDNPDLPQRFLYQTRIGFGLVIAGEGETVGTRNAEDGSRTSALKFWSDAPISLIKEGSGYWQYRPEANGIRFLTRYDYRTRFGFLGRFGDKLVFRPLIGWATAWSFDRLRLWLEKGIDPRLSLERFMVYGLSRLTLAFVWFYQGLVPKLLFPDTGERSILEKARVFSGTEGTVLQMIGVGEMLFGLCFLIFWDSRIPLFVNIGALIFLTLIVVFSQPNLFVAPFNPITLNLLLIVIAVIALLIHKDLPSARHCRRTPEVTKS